MLEKENTILKNLDKKMEALDRKVDGLAGEFNHLKKQVDGRILLIAEKMNSVAKRVDERMDRFEESNRKNGILLEKLDGKFDLALA